MSNVTQAAALRTEQQIFAKCAWRLIPFMLVLYIVNFIDRTNIGFAALSMNRDLGLSPSVYGFGAALFMAGYLLCEAPSNVVLARVGARLWIFRIMVTWGVVAASCALIQGPATLYGLRFLLGIAEAGFYPGMLLYLTYWFPQAYRARFQAMFIAGAPLAAVIGAPVSSLVLGMDGVLGLHGWQWVFVLEGIPALLLAFAVLKLLPDGFAAARWLSTDEKEIIAERLAAERAPERHGLWHAFREPRAIALGCVLFGIGFVRLGLGLWLPLIAQNAGLGRMGVGLAVAVPYFLSVGAMVWWGRSSDRRSERFAHIAIPIVTAAAALLVASLTSSLAGLLLALSCAIICIEALQGPFWCLPSLYLSSQAAAAGIGLIAATGNFGGFIGTMMMGVLRQSTGAYSTGFVILAGVLTASLVAVAIVRALEVERMSGYEHAPTAANPDF